MQQVSCRSALQIGVAVAIIGIPGCTDDPPLENEPTPSDDSTPGTEPLPDTESPSASM